MENQIPKKFVGVLDKIVQMTREFVNRDGGIQPIAMVFAKGEVRQMNLALESQDEVHDTADALKTLIAESQAEACLLILQSWTIGDDLKDLDQEELHAEIEKYGSIHDHPSSIEVLLFNFESRGGVFQAWPKLQLDGDTTTFGEVNFEPVEIVGGAMATIIGLDDVKFH